MKSLAACLAVATFAASADAQAPREVAVSASPTAAPSQAPVPAGSAATSAWIVSETRSPVDYSPVAVATAASNGLRLAIQCRGGRTEMVLSSTSTPLRSQEVLVAHAINGAAAVSLTIGAADTGTGLALKGDVPRFLMSLPEQGELALRVTDRAGDAVEGRYALGALKKLVGRLAGPCAWPTATGH
jgi:hypothetical protein